MTRSALFQFISRSFAVAVEALSCDSTLKVGAFLLSLATACVGIWQYRDAKAKEYQKVFFDERMRTYIELSETVAKIATHAPQSKERYEALQRYWQLYFGRVQMVTDAEVDDALHKTSKWIVHCVEKPPSPPDKTLCYDVAGNGYALLVAKAARNSITRTWRIPLEDLGEKDIHVKSAD